MYQRAGRGVFQEGRGVCVCVCLFVCLFVRLFVCLFGLCVVSVWFVCFVCFGDDSHRRDARRSDPCEDRRDAETAHQVCDELSYLCFQLENQTS